MTHILMIVSLGALVIGGQVLHRTVYSPSSVLAGVWLLLAAGHFVFADDYYINMAAAGLSILHVVAFFLGDVAGAVALYIAGRSKRPIFVAAQRDISPHRLKGVILALGLVSFVGTMAYFMIFLAHFGSLSRLLSAGWQVREDIGLGLISVPLPVRMAMLCGYSVHLLALVYWLRFGLSWIMLIGPACILLSGITQSGRAGTLILVLMWIAAYLWKGLIIQRVSLFKMARGAFFGAFVCGIIFVVGMLYRSQKTSSTLSSADIYRESKIYALGALSGLSSFLDDPPPNRSPGHGVYSYASLAQLLGLHSFVFGIYEEYYSVSKRDSELQLSTNVYTWLRPALDDFGYWGTLLYFFAGGALVSIVYILARSGQFWAIPAVFCSITILMFSVFAALTQHTSILAALFVPSILLHFCTRTGLRDPVNGPPMASQGIATVTKPCLQLQCR